MKYEQSNDNDYRSRITKSQIVPLVDHAAENSQQHCIHCYIDEHRLKLGVPIRLTSKRTTSDKAQDHQQYPSPHGETCFPDRNTGLHQHPQPGYHFAAQTLRDHL
jgi:hypothetical protein